ncbi:MAG: hypothetical protein KC535_01105 [Nanoarchaeota archaeon]|nr:hypothetical protein [Nanoarchaeota archaeon]
MERTFKDILRSLLPLSKKHRRELKKLSSFLSADQLKDAKYLLKTKKIALGSSAHGVSTSLATIPALYQFNSLVSDRGVNALIKDFNSIMEEGTYERSYKEFSTTAAEKIKEYIAPNILGMELVKEAALLQLFSEERFHLLLIGDPGTGKTDILRSSAALSPISSFGLGSGTSGAGLSIMMKGGEMEKGLLPLADGGLCCIDELNLMKKNDRAALYSAMEKGFITYNKGGNNKKITSEVRVQATANPTGDRFVGKSLSILKQQLPFDSALLTRFHLVFVIRQPSTQELVNIAKKIIRSSSIKLRQEDIDYVKSYVAHANKIAVAFDKRFEHLIADFIATAKENESKYLVEIGPRTVHGIMRLAQAYARIELRSKVIESDVKKAIELMEKSFHIDDIIRP